MTEAIIRRTGTFFLAGLLTAVFGVGSVTAQELEFSPDELESGGDDGGAVDDGGDLSFDVIDTDEVSKDVAAQREAERDLIRVIQRRPFLRNQRFEVAPFIGTNINDPLVTHFVAGGNLNYHITEVMAVGINGAYSLGSETGLFDEVIQDYELFPEVAQVQWYGLVHFQYVPLYGKLALFDTWIIPWDWYAIIGAGFTQTELDGHPTLMLGFGQRYFMNRWFATNIEFRDHIFNENFPSGSEIINNLTFTAGVTFFLPPDFEYTTLR
jgi:outer membrane beta-barrel protein